MITFIVGYDSILLWDTTIKVTSLFLLDTVYFKFSQAWTTLLPNQGSLLCSKKLINS